MISIFVPYDSKSELNFITFINKISKRKQLSVFVPQKLFLLFCLKFPIDKPLNHLCVSINCHSDNVIDFEPETLFSIKRKFEAIWIILNIIIFRTFIFFAIFVISNSDLEEKSLFDYFHIERKHRIERNLYQKREN